MNTITPSIRWPGLPLRRDDVWVRRTDDEAVLLGPDGKSIHLLNDTAAALWELCDGTTTTGEMVQAILDFFAVSEQQASADVDRTIATFDELGIVEWR